MYSHQAPFGLDQDCIMVCAHGFFFKVCKRARDSVVCLTSINAKSGIEDLLAGVPHRAFDLYDWILRIVR